MTMEQASPIFLLNLPQEILIEIFSRTAENASTRLVCRPLRDVVESIPLLWTSIFIGPQQFLTPMASSFLNRRLGRAGVLPLQFSIHMDSTIHYGDQLKIWSILSTYKMRIRSLDIHTATSCLAGWILNDILCSNSTQGLPELTELSIRVDDDKVLSQLMSVHPCDPATLLKHMSVIFPSIQALTLPMFYDSIPYLTAPVPSLHTVIIDGSSLLNHDITLHQILVFLQHTPNLQIFWFREPEQLVVESVDGSSAGPTDVDPTVVHLPLSLPRLKSLAVSVPGTGRHLLHLVDVPMLEDLHMDSSRDRANWEEDVEWSPELLAESLAELAPHAPALRRIAITEAHVFRETWEWLLGCSADPQKKAPPFPQLESIAVHGLKEIHREYEIINMLDDEFIQSYASSTNPSRINLLRFAALQSELDFRGETILKMADSIIQRTGKHFELEIDFHCPGITQTHLNALISRGVRVIHHNPGEVVPNKRAWWTLGRDIDPQDSHAY